MVIMVLEKTFSTQDYTIIRLEPYIHDFSWPWKHILLYYELNTGLNNFCVFVSDDGRSEIDTSLVVSMEINGIMYQGVLFAQHPHRLGV